ncbi:MAG: hypothetical protein ACRC6N_04635 [Plesiomonas sp.]|uniref:hypothetical protein n=1 Tax=Plesiomonas sp. TaxID=2486279 RepID=UPI003F37A987
MERWRWRTNEREREREREREKEGAKEIAENVGAKATERRRWNVGDGREIVGDGREIDGTWE